MNLKEIFDIIIIDKISIGDIIAFCTKGLGIYLLTSLLSWFIKHLFKHSINRKGNVSIDPTSAGFLQHILIWIVYTIGITTFLSMIPGMKRIADSILASAGILAMAVGLASKEALGNFVSGIFIIMGKPFRVGDIIKAGDVVYGTVMEINLRHTVIRNFENQMIMVPNSIMNNATIVNTTIGDQSCCSYIEIGVSYSTNLDHAMDVMREEVMKHTKLSDHRTPEQKNENAPLVVVRITQLGDSAITLRAYAWADNFSDAFVMKCDLLKSIKERFDKEKIEIPYPYQNIVVKSNS
jgi:small conductance mechanosensitive channel